MVIDVEEAVTLLGRVVAGNEDFIYNPEGTTRVCLYVENGECSCMVGRALGLVFPIETIAKLDTAERGDPPEAVRAVNIHLHLDDITENACVIFGKAQARQDGGETWGDALTAAKDAAEWFKLESSE